MLPLLFPSLIAGLVLCAWPDPWVRRFSLCLLSWYGCLEALVHLQDGGSFFVWEPVALASAAFGSWELRLLRGSRRERRALDPSPGIWELLVSDPRLSPDFDFAGLAAGLRLEMDGRRLQAGLGAG